MAPAAAHDKAILLWPEASPDMAETAAQLAVYGCNVELPGSVAELLRRLGQGHARGALLDCRAAAGLSPDGARALRAGAGAVPLIGLADTGDIATRLDAVRMGCQAFLPRPLDIGLLLDTLERLGAAPLAEAGRVLVVDDSASAAALYASVLEGAGFRVKMLTDPLKVLDALQSSPPELILMDMYMPGATGEELARVIRQQDAYLSIPIVFLSAEADQTRQREAMALGGDEFLQKPIEPEHLVSAVKSRIIRYRALRGVMARDSLTGLLNHTNFKDRLRVELARAQRHGHPVSLAMVDIDHFKRVNDTWGHPAGDRVIKNLAQLLKRRLRGGDLIGRYGGEEFALALPDTPVEVARKVLEDIRGKFSCLTHGTGERSFGCTLSAGLAVTPPAHDPESIIQAADFALYAAKHGGRDRVEVNAG
ncbi:MAG: diguanylate cyclase [Betaproteobacteria bacterium]|nr:diguanylate cyclase [Betaproteobacteria bacterium]